MSAGLQERQIYKEGRGPETLKALVKATRRDQIIAVYGGLRIFGLTHRAISDATTLIKKRGGIIVDVETGQRSDRDGIEMLSGALAALRGEKTLGGQAAEIGALGGQAKARSSAKLRMPEAQALRIWRDKRISRDMAISRMWGWKLGTAKYHLGPSGREKGPLNRKK